MIQQTVAIQPEVAFPAGHSQQSHSRAVRHGQAGDVVRGERRPAIGAAVNFPVRNVQAVKLCRVEAVGNGPDA